MRFLLKVYFSGILIFTLFRGLLILFNLQVAGTATSDLIFKAFVMGFRFDTVVSCYLLLFPALLLLNNLLKKHKSYLVIRIVARYTIIVYCVAFFVCCVDIPYFRHYLTRVTISILNWSNNPMFMLKMVFQDLPNYFFLALFGILIFLSILRVKAINDIT